ncbi:MAG TPA: hypothetical protein VIY27_02095 [Myxococcota bacterium]
MSYLGQAPKLVPGIITPSYLPQGSRGKMPDPSELLRAGLPLAPVIEHGSWATGQPSIMRYGRDPYRGLFGDSGDGMGADPEEVRRNVGRAWSVLGPLSAAASAYHGYKRHRGSLGWAIGWAIMGSLFPVITPAIAVAQGFGQPMRQRR